jgi:hypothetical protein
MSLVSTVARVTAASSTRAAMPASSSTQATI